MRSDPEEPLSVSPEVRATYRDFYEGPGSFADRVFVGGFLGVRPSECEQELVHLSDRDESAPPDAGVWLRSLWDRGIDASVPNKLRGQVRVGSLGDGRSSNYVLVRSSRGQMLVIFRNEDLRLFGQDAELTTEGTLAA